MRVISDRRCVCVGRIKAVTFITSFAIDGNAGDRQPRGKSFTGGERTFYRNKAAWLVGKLITPSGTCHFYCRSTRRTTASYLLIPADDDRRSEHCFWLCAFLFYGFAPLPAALVEWLREILPGKTTLNCIWLSAARSTPKLKATAISRLSTGL